ncbi:hypothetical protein EDB86DRAFT_2930119 [Lactarius hatsudake]|nr:hypothetical protein EDB86DRAFT_2930119 [Lactarius hatsudake]
MVTIGTIVEDSARRKGYSCYSCRVYVANGEFSLKIFKLGVISDLVCAFYAWGHLDAVRQLESNWFKRPIDHIARSICNVQVDPDMPSRCSSTSDSMAPFKPFHTALRSARKSLRASLNNILNEWDDSPLELVLIDGDDTRRQSSASTDAYWVNKCQR